MTLQFIREENFGQRVPIPWMHTWAQHCGLKYGKDYPTNIEADALLELVGERAADMDVDDVLALETKATRRDFRYTTKVARPKLNHILELIEAAKFKKLGLEKSVTVEIYGQKCEIVRLSFKGGNCTLRNIDTGATVMVSPSSLRRNARVKSSEGAH